MMGPLLADKNNCTGCTACMSVCPCNAITMQEDDYGFLYPVISKDCNECNLCNSICPVLNSRDDETIINETYAAYAKSGDILKTSSSGGVFALLATEVLKDDGIVYGCAQINDFSAVHVRVVDEIALNSLKGSKYIQSNLNDIFRHVESDLNAGKKVLFSGTPCQVLGLKAYLGREYNNLITVDLVCHGVTSRKIFFDYLKWFEDKYKCKILEYIFRDTKKKGMRCDSRMVVVTNKGKKKTFITYYHSKFYFYYLYMFGYIYRESCYKCPCLPNKRVSDITLGDYWGVELIIPEWVDVKGVSLCIIHSKKGSKLFDSIDAIKTSVDYDISIIHNTSVKESVVKPEARCEIWDRVLNADSEGIYNICKRLIGKSQFIIFIKHLIPLQFKRRIQALLYGKMHLNVKYDFKGER